VLWEKLVTTSSALLLRESKVAFWSALEAKVDDWSN
jgi:hypothetical protein